MVNTTGVILAGGKSSRMGMDKAYLEIGGSRVILAIIRILRSLFPEVVIVTNSPGAFEGCGVPTVPDVVPGKGPLGGIHAGLMHIDTKYAFFVACDMPFVNKEFIRYMVAQSPGYDIVVPFFRGMYEPLHAVYSQGCLPYIEEALSAPKPMIIQFFPRVRVRAILPEEIQRFGSEGELFFNINRPDDLEAAKSLLKRQA